jgi:hypothetical protein
MGLVMQPLILAVQNGLALSEMGAGTAAVTFFRTLGGAFGVAVFGAILTNRLAHNLSALLPNGGSNVDVGSVAAGPAAIRQLPPSVQDAVIHALANSLHVVFLAAVPLSVVAFLVTWLLPERPLRETSHIGAEAVGDDLLEGFGQLEPEHTPEP